VLHQYQTKLSDEMVSEITGLAGDVKVDTTKEDEKEAQKAANRSKGEYLVLLFLFWCASLILLLGNLTMPTFGVLLANVAVHSALFQLMISQRTLVSQN